MPEVKNKKRRRAGGCPTVRNPARGAVVWLCPPHWPQAVPQHLATPSQQGSPKVQGAGRAGQAMPRLAVPSHPSSSAFFLAGGFPSRFRVQQIHLPAPPGGPAHSRQVRAWLLPLPPAHLLCPSPHCVSRQALSLTAPKGWGPGQSPNEGHPLPAAATIHSWKINNTFIFM